MNNYYDVISASEAASIIGISVSHLYKLCNPNKVVRGAARPQFFRNGKHFSFHRGAIQEFAHQFYGVPLPKNNVPQEVTKKINYVQAGWSDGAPFKNPTTTLPPLKDYDGFLRRAGKGNKGYHNGNKLFINPPKKEFYLVCMQSKNGPLFFVGVIPLKECVDYITNKNWNGAVVLRDNEEEDVKQLDPIAFLEYLIEEKATEYTSDYPDKPYYIVDHRGITVHKFSGDWS